MIVGALCAYGHAVVLREPCAASTQLQTLRTLHRVLDRIPHAIELRQCKSSPTFLSIEVSSEVALGNGGLARRALIPGRFWRHSTAVTPTAVEKANITTFDTQKEKIAR